MEQTVGSRVNTQVATGGTLAKLIVFAVSLGVLPLTSYFVSLKYAWNGNTTWAAITAVVAANVVLVTYIVLSLLEDRSSAQPTDKKKDR